MLNVCCYENLYPRDRGRAFQVLNNGDGVSKQSVLMEYAYGAADDPRERFCVTSIRPAFFRIIFRRKEYQVPGTSGK